MSKIDQLFTEVENFPVDVPLLKVGDLYVLFREGLFVYPF
jgi:hypothetical protein